LHELKQLGVMDLRSH